MTVVSGEKQTETQKNLPAESGDEAVATEGNGGERSYHYYPGNTDPTC